MASKTSKEVKDAYFTKPETAKWCINQLQEHYTLKGKTALEPACGSGAFVEAAEGTGLKWKTNELFPEFSQGYSHDFNIDFAKGDISPLGTYDFVITNPPFGHASTLAKKFIKRSLEIAPVVAMLLPKGCRPQGDRD
jgi:predicted RNA methylase